MKKGGLKSALRFGAWWGLRGEVFEGKEQDLVDARAVEVDDLDEVAVAGEGLAFGGEAAEVFHDEAGEGRVVAVGAGV